MPTLGVRSPCLCFQRCQQWMYLPRCCRPSIRTRSGSRFEKKSIHFPSSIEEERETACYSQEQVERILGAAEGQYKILFATAAGTGMRAGELYGLQVEDIDFSRNVIHVRRSAWEGELQSPKTRNARRAISVTRSLANMLKDHLDGRTTGLLFPCRAYKGRQRPLRNSNVLKWGLHPLLRELKIPIAGMHAFRHYRVTALMESNVPLETIKAWIGHGSEAMTVATHVFGRTASRNILQPSQMC